MRVAFVVPAFVAAALLYASLAPAQQGAVDDYDLMPDDIGRDETYSACAACHSMKLVAQQGLTREDWDEALVWMVEEQEMEELEAAERDLVLDYLTKYYGPDRAARRMMSSGGG